MNIKGIRRHPNYNYIHIIETDDGEETTVSPAGAGQVSAIAAKLCERLDEAEAIIRDLLLTEPDTNDWTVSEWETCRARINRARDFLRGAVPE